MNFELLPILTDYANLKKGGMKFKALRNMTVGTSYREDGSEHNRF